MYSNEFLHVFGMTITGTNEVAIGLLTDDGVTMGFGAQTEK
jgi:hypothetical protein